MHSASGYASSLVNPAPVAKHPISGVEALNITLTDMIRRINEAANRVGMIANQFGAPSVEGAGSAPLKDSVTTNDLTAHVNVALTDLERTISRIDHR